MSAIGTLGIVLFGATAFLLSYRAVQAAGRRFLLSQRRLAELDLAAMFVFATGARLAMLTIAFALALAVTSWLAGAGAAVVSAIFCVSLFVPRIVVRQLRRKRLERIGSQLPDALSFWAGLLQSGQGLHTALGQLAERQASPLGDELRVVVRQCRLGVPVEVAMNDLCERLDIADLRLLCSLLRVARDLGGNLGESLLRLSALLRARLSMEARIRSLTAQGRLQGLIVGALPVVLLFVLSFMEPQAMSVLYREPLGWAGLGVIVLLEALGFVLIRRIVSIRI